MKHELDFKELDGEFEFQKLIVRSVVAKYF